MYILVLPLAQPSRKHIHHLQKSSRVLLLGFCFVLFWVVKSLDIRFTPLNKILSTQYLIIIIIIMYYNILLLTISTMFHRGSLELTLLLYLTLYPFLNVKI